MKRAVIATAMLVCALSPAFATTHYEMTWRDMIRPHGHNRGQPVHDAALNACYNATGLPRDAAATRAFSDCMKGRGYRLISTKLVRDPRSAPQGASFIDPDTGMSCKDIGGASTCEPPQGTVKYIDEDGLSCTRTGAVSFCSNL
jgi:hypothetical protein